MTFFPVKSTGKKRPNKLWQKKIIQQKLRSSNLEDNRGKRVRFWTMEQEKCEKNRNFFIRLVFVQCGRLLFIFQVS